MLEDIVKQLMLLKPTIITSAVGMVTFMVVMLIICNKFSFTGKNLKILGFFFDMKVSDSISLAVSILKFFLIVSMFFAGGKIQTVHIVCFAMLVVVFNICQLKIKSVLVSFFNSTVIIGVLMLIKFLVAYMHDVLFDVRILIAVVLLGIFLTLYTIYDIGLCVSIIIDRRSKLVNKEKK